MSARKLDHPELLQPVRVQSQTTSLNLPASAVRIRKNGIEFRAAAPIPVWTEMTMSLETPQDPRRVNCTAVVVACHGARPSGFWASRVFTGPSLAAQRRL